MKLLKKILAIAYSFVIIYVLIALIIGVDNANMIATAFIESILSVFKP